MATSRNTAGQVIEFVDTCRNCSSSTNLKLYTNLADKHFLVYCDVCNWSFGIDDSNIDLSEEDEVFAEDVTSLDLLFCNTEQLLLFVDSCNECKSTNLTTYVHVKDNLILINCEDCHWSFGLDDTAGYHFNLTKKDSVDSYDFPPGSVEPKRISKGGMDPEIKAVSDVLQVVDACNKCSSENLGYYIDNEINQFMLVSCNDCEWFYGIDDTTSYHLNFSNKNDRVETDFPSLTESYLNSLEDGKTNGEKNTSFLSIFLDELKKMLDSIGNRRFFVEYSFGRRLLLTYEALMKLFLKLLNGRGIIARQVTSYDEIEIGDHISWTSNTSQTLKNSCSSSSSFSSGISSSIVIYHHAIVTKIDKLNDLIHVIDYNGNSKNTLERRIKAQVQQSVIEKPFEDRNKKKVMKHYYLKCLPKVEVIKRAFSRLGEKKYQLFKNNCEHFATWCKTGEAFSLQVENVKNLKPPNSE